MAAGFYDGALEKRTGAMVCRRPITQRKSRSTNCGSVLNLGC